jgi:hypothetical protein
MLPVLDILGFEWIGFEELVSCNVDNLMGKMDLIL